MERSAIMIVCNGEPYVGLQLKHVYGLVDEIIIAEGPQDKHFENLIQSKRSNDGTIQTIKKFPDPDKKITLLYTNCDKNKMVAKANRICNGKYIYQIDVDEFLSEGMINAGFEALAKDRCDNIQVPERWYYKWYDTFLSSGRPGHIRALPNRFYRNKIDIGSVICHIPWNGYFDKNGKYYGAKSAALSYKEFTGHHYLAIYRSHLVRKMRYYAAARAAVTTTIANNKIAEFDATTRRRIGKRIETYNSNLLEMEYKKFGIPVIDDNIEWLKKWPNR